MVMTAGDFNPSRYQSAVWIAEAAAEVSTAAESGSVNHAYAAGVEDALRFLLAGEAGVSANVFRHFDEAMAPLSEAAKR